MSGWKPVERAYSLWLRAAREDKGGAAALGRALETYLRKAHGLTPDADLRDLGVETELTGRTIGRWEKGTAEKPQPQYPGDRWSREALVAVVTELVPVPPVQMDWNSFRGVCEAFAADRLERIERGSGNLESHAAQERNKERHQFLAAWPSRAGLIDPVALGLGSWAFDGALPPYVHRTVDGEFAMRLKEPGTTTVTGAPKSGKSRSILETLQRHHPEAVTWWVNPSPTVLPLVVENAKKAKGSERPAFIVLDDAGLIGTDPVGGLTARRMSDLATSCTHLVVVIHDETLAGWEHQLTHRTAGDFDAGGIGATRELIDLLTHRIRYASVLNDNETDPAAKAYENADDRVKSFDLTRLAETLAGVQTLLAAARKTLQTPNSLEPALLEAAIDASIAFPSGATPEIFAALTAWHYGQRQPNRPWRPHLFDQAFDTLTTGITAGSPHAILTKGDHETYRLLDALAPELQQPNRDTLTTVTQSRLTEEALRVALRNTGSWHYIRNEIDQARRAARTWWERMAGKGDAMAMISLGLLANESANLEGARAWWERAADHGNPGAMFLVGCLAHETGDLEVARTLWKHAAGHGHTGAMFNLGFVAHASGDLDMARSCWRRAAERGDAAAMNSLGMLYREAGATGSARAWWVRAAKKGDTAAIFNLELANMDMEASVRLAETEDTTHVYVPYKEAHLWREPAAQHGLIDAMDALAELTEFSAMNVDAKDRTRGASRLW